MKSTCECSDPGCQEHKSASVCRNTATAVVRRFDMDDGTTTFEFCDGCAEDAMASGVFSWVKEIR